MRVLMAVLALVAVPFVASVSQESAGDNPGVRHAYARGHDHKCANDLRSDANHADRKDNDHDRTCADPPPPPPPPPSPPPPTQCWTAPPPLSGATITGTLYNGVYGGPGLACWTVTVSDGTTTWSAVTDTTGSYTVTGLAGGATYSVCEVVQTGWHQTYPPAGFPSCGLAGYGYSFALSPGNSAAFVDFVNAVGP
ncbi:MAG TPA: hypothetical protein VEU55_01240 [Gemmatimonadales bacterium]|nr:hypothetical protein [Gemmatimonadales bacterium]